MTNTTYCTYCGAEVQSAAATVCPQCGVALEVVPWEHPSTGPWLVRWWRTCLMGMRTPLGLFRRLRPDGGLSKAMGFFVLCAVVHSLIAPMITMQLTSSIAQRLIGAHLGSEGVELSFDDDTLSLFDEIPGRPRAAEARPKRAPVKLPIEGTNLLTGLSVLASGFGFLFAFVSLFSLAATFQLGALLFIPGRQPFAETVRVTAYAHAPAVCALVPVVGQIVFAVWMSYLWFVGLREIHHTTNGRIVLAMTLVPLVLAMILGVGCLALVTQLTARL